MTKGSGDLDFLTPSLGFAIFRQPGPPVATVLLKTTNGGQYWSGLQPTLR